MDIFESNDYREYLKKRMELAPKSGRGQALKLSRAIGISTTLMSQILNGQREMSLEQAALVCEYFGMNEGESEFFLLLVQKERAGNTAIKKIADRQLKNLKEKNSKIINRLNINKNISDEDKAVFYSDWYYSAVRQLTAIPGLDTAEAIADHLGLPNKMINEIVRFLLSAGLVAEENGKLKIGPNRTHLDAESPWIKMHHSNWRYKALEFIKYSYPEKLHYSSPMTLSKSDCEKIRIKIVKLIEEVGKTVDPSPSEELMCLNIDWFKIRPTN